MEISVPKPVDQLVHDPFAVLGVPSQAALTLPPSQRIELLEAVLLKCAQTDIPIEHVFAPGIYMRQGKIAKGTFLIGHRHKTQHINVVFCGRVTVMTDEAMFEVTGPATFVAEAGTRKVIYAHEDAVMANIHPTTETDLTKIEEQFIMKSETYQLFHQGLKSQLMLLAESLAAEAAALPKEH